MSGSGSHSKLTGNEVIGLVLIVVFVVGISVLGALYGYPVAKERFFPEPTPTPSPQIALREGSNPDLIADCRDDKTTLQGPTFPPYFKSVLDTVRAQRLLTDDQFRNSNFAWIWSQEDGLEYELRTPVGRFQFGVRCFLADQSLLFSYVEIITD